MFGFGGFEIKNILQILKSVQQAKKYIWIWKKNTYFLTLSEAVRFILTLGTPPPSDEVAVVFCFWRFRNFVVAAMVRLEKVDAFGLFTTLPGLNRLVAWRRLEDTDFNRSEVKLVLKRAGMIKIKRLLILLFTAVYFYSFQFLIRYIFLVCFFPALVVWEDNQMTYIVGSC